MPKCTFCKKDYEFPRGLTLVSLDGTAKYLCSSKCRRNMKLGRDARKVKWIKKAKNDAVSK